MNPYAKAFRITVWAGVIANFAVAALMLFVPDWWLSINGLGAAYPDVWVRFAAWLLILLSLFYIPGANDLNRYRANAVLQVVSRFAGVLFFSAAVLFLRINPRFLLSGLFDFTFLVPSAFFLVMAIRTQGPTPAASDPRAKDSQNVAAADRVAQTL
jgi:hypothetical protein